MKASMKFREDKKPLFRAKIPLSIIGLPFQSGIVAGESKELSLNLSTFFESGPSLKLSYRPNDSYNPFSLIVKTGTGSLGSPISTSMLMTAEFNLLGQQRNSPSFMIHFKPQFGDFSVKKSHSSSHADHVNGSVSEEDSSIEIVDSVVDVNGSVLSKDVAGLLSGVDVAARTSLPVRGPVRGRAVVNFRWGVRVPMEVSDPTAVVSLRRFPFLVMDKVGIEHVDGKDVKVSKTSDVDVGKVCLVMEELRSENRELKRAVEDLRGVMVSNVSHSSKQHEAERSNNKSKNNNGRARTTSDCGGKKSKEEGNVEEELKKALKGAAA